MGRDWLEKRVETRPKAAVGTCAWYTGNSFSLLGHACPACHGPFRFRASVCVCERERDRERERRGRETNDSMVTF